MRAHTHTHTHTRVLTHTHSRSRTPHVQDGDRFWRMPEAYIRGNTIKYLRVPDEVLDKAKEAEAQMKRDGALLLAGCRA